MSEQQNGGQAFPVAGSDHNYPIEGMTLRDYLAAKAMASIVDGAISVGQGFDSHTESERLAEASYRIADAMLRARETS